MNVINDPCLKKIFQTDKRTNWQKTFDSRRSVNVWNNPGFELSRKIVKFVTNDNNRDKKNYLDKVSRKTKSCCTEVQLFHHPKNVRT